jgi:hypothetical protein
LSSAGEVDVPPGRRAPLSWRPMLLVLAVAGAVLADAALMPQPWRGIEHRILLAVRWPALSVLILLLAVGLVGLVLTAGSPLTLPVVGAEEPRLDPPSFAASPAEVRVVTLAGLEPGCGVTTLAFNLAVSLAVLGEKPGADQGPQPVRPACLLAESPLSAALGLSPQPLEDQLAKRPWDVRPEIVHLGARHSSGCALFCMRGGERAGDGLHRLVEQLRRHYDAVLIDGAVSQPETSSVLDSSDLLLLLALPTHSSVEAAGRWIERVWGTRRETTTVMIVNRVPAWPPPPRELILAFHHVVLLPEDPAVAALDGQALPWSLDDRVAVAPRLTGLARLLFPALNGGGGRRAA